MIRSNLSYRRQDNFAGSKIGRGPARSRAKEGAAPSTQRNAPPGAAPQTPGFPCLGAGLSRCSEGTADLHGRRKCKGLSGTILAMMPSGARAACCASLSLLSLASPGLAIRGEPVQRDNPCATQSLLRCGTGPSRPWLGRSPGQQSTGLLSFSGSPTGPSPATASPTGPLS